MPLLERFRRDECEALAGYLIVRTVEPGTVIFREGDGGSHLCILLDGKLDVTRAGSDGRPRRIAVALPGRLIGEMALIDGQPYSATVSAASPSTLALLSRDALNRICEERPRIGNRLLWKIAELLSLRLRQTTGRLMDFL